MTDLPIIFSAPMVQALLAGRKTMTRRLAWKKETWAPHLASEHLEDFELRGWDCQKVNDGWQIRQPSPWQKVQPGDRLWVGENVAGQQVNHHWELVGGKSVEIISTCIDYGAEGYRTWIKLPADEMPKVLSARKNRKGTGSAKGSPNIHLPEIASRLTLIVTATKVEPLHDITEADAEAEGMFSRPVTMVDRSQRMAWFNGLHNDAACDTAKQAFEFLWGELHGAESLDANPDVVALTFRVVRENIDRIKEAAQ